MATAAASSTAGAMVPVAGGSHNHHSSDPLCRCRVLYIGSAIPTITKDGLQGIQQPLRERYPASDSPDTKGIDSWLSVWSNGLLLEYVDGERRTESAFFPISTLHYCAAVRYVNMTGFAVEGGGERFIPLDSPFAQIPDSPHPPIFAAIFRRTHGVKVLECHAFVCTNEKAANALVRCCFHSYADTLYLKMEEKMPPHGNGGMRAIKEPSRSETPNSELNFSEQENGLDISDWNERAIGQKAWQRRQQNGEYDASSLSSSVLRQKGVPRKGVATTPGGGRTRSEGGYAEGIIVPYGGIPHHQRTTTGSQAELRDSSSDGHARQSAPFFYATPPLPGPFLRAGHPPPPHLFAHHPPPPPHPFFTPMPPRFMPFGPFPPPPPPPHFGRFVFPPHPFAHPPPPRMFFMPPPPPFLGAHHAARSKSPERSGPIITETVYDTFPRHNRGTTYEEPIYMPSSNGGNGTLPPQASYKPGSFSPEIYEHYYETYNRQQQKSGGRKNASRSNSDASGDDSNAHHYWESYEASMFQPAAQQQPRKGLAGANTMVGGSKQQQQQMNGAGTPKASRKVAPEEQQQKGSEGTLTRDGGNGGGGGTPREGTGRADSFNRGLGGARAGRKAEPRPETPPADYDVVTERTTGGQQQRQRQNGGMVAY